ncbi:hypothetical protein BHM03_00002698 [Ensete ventricosum]|nr:hypothetical protein BHM03_00002698 [Ensete ventricosum]
MPGVRVVRRALAGGEVPTLPVPGRLYDTWRPLYNRSTSHVGLVTSLAQVSEGVMTWQPGRHLILVFLAPSSVTGLGCWIQALSISGGSNFTLSGLNFTNSQQKHIGIYGIVGVQVHGINIAAPGDSPNTDGIYIRSCQHVTVSNSTIGTGNGLELERTGWRCINGFRFPGLSWCSPPACRR